MLPGGATPISFITEERSLSPSSFIRNSIGVPCGSLSLSGELRTSHVPPVCLNGLGPCLFAGDGGVSDEGNYIPSYPSRTFWFKPVSTFGLFAFTAFSGSSHLLAIPSNPSAPTTLVLVVITFPRGSVILSQEGYIVPRASHPRIASDAGLSRVLVGEHQVKSCFTQSQQPHRRLHVANNCRKSEPSLHIGRATYVVSLWDQVPSCILL